MQFSVRYILIFATLVCAVCAIMVSTSAVTLRERQEINEKLEKQKNVLEAAGFVEAGEKVGRERVDELFEQVTAVAVEIETGEETDAVDPLAYDMQDAKRDPERSREAPKNKASVFRLPDYAVVYKVFDEDGRVSKLVLPVEGYGLWGTLYGFIALGPDGRTIEGLTFYQHKETPGLGGEVDNPRWKDLWPGRMAYDDDGDPKIEVIKGIAGPPQQAPYKVDGLSGATITSRGVTNLLQFWLGPKGLGSYIENFRESQGETLDAASEAEAASLGETEEAKRRAA